MLRVRTGALRSPGGNLPRVEERAETQVLISETKKYEESCRQRKQHVSKLGEGRELASPGNGRLWDMAGEYEIGELSRGQRGR